MHTIFINELI